MKLQELHKSVVWAERFRKANEEVTIWIDGIKRVEPTDVRSIVSADNRPGWSALFQLKSGYFFFIRQEMPAGAYLARTLDELFDLLNIQKYVVDNATPRWREEMLAAQTIDRAMRST